MTSPEDTRASSDVAEPEDIREEQAEGLNDPPLDVAVAVDAVLEP